MPERPKTVRSNGHVDPRQAANGYRPLVSVVIPTYNRAQFIGRAVGSALRQTVRDIEVVVVDDGSVDGTSEVIAQIDDERLRSVKLARRGGGARARNAGISVARADWIAFLDSDDEWLPTKLEAQLERTRSSASPDATLVCCGAYRQDANGPRRVHLRQDLPEGEVLDSLLLSRGRPQDRGLWLTTSALLVKRSALVEIGGFDSRLPSFQEFDLLLRLARASHRVVPLDEPLMIKHDHLMGRIGTDPVAKLSGFLCVARSWRHYVVSELGVPPYGRWIRRRTERVRAMHEQRIRELAAMGRRRDALRYISAMAPHAIWGRRYLMRALALAVSLRRPAGHAEALSE